MEKLVDDPVTSARLIVDPVNEPDTQNINWEDKAENGHPGLKTLYLEVFDMLYEMNPSLLFFIQVGWHFCHTQKVCL